MWWERTKAKKMLSAGAVAPSFQLQLLAGGSESLEAILARGPVLLAFFKISCPVCQLTFPYLERIAAGTGLQLIGISQDDSRATQNFNQHFGITFPMLLDQSKDCYPASNAYGISSVPSLFLVEPDGKISTAFSGFSKRDFEALGERAGVKPFQPSDQVPEWKAG